MADPHTINLVTQSVDETVTVGRAIAPLLEIGDCLALIGPLGAGKTQLVRGLAAGLGADDGLVASPTFVLMHEYPGPRPLIHLDAYRLRDFADLETVGWSDELIASAVIVVEWADRIAEHLPDDHVQISLDHVDESSRRFAVTGRGTWADRVSSIADELQSAGLNTESDDAHHCPSCHAAVSDDAATFPFCSSRCKLVDLHHWFGGSFSVSRPAEEDDLYDEHLATEP